MPTTPQQKRAAFRALHQQGCFVLPNPWDVGSARMLQHMGFAALASSSSGYAWTTGHADYAVTLTDVLEHLTMLCNAVDLPVNADFESGFAPDEQGVYDNVTRAIQTGIAGVSIEDQIFGGACGLYDTATALQRVQAARRAIDASGEDVMLVARTEILLSDPGKITVAIDKLVAFAEAGAHCLYAPGVRNRDDIAAMVRAVSPKPVNVLVSSPGLSVAELTDLGVRRISVGGALARVGWGAVMGAAEQIKSGSFDGLGSAASGKRLNDMFDTYLD